MQQVVKINKLFDEEYEKQIRKISLLIDSKHEKSKETLVTQIRQLTLETGLMMIKMIHNIVYSVEFSGDDQIRYNCTYNLTTEIISKMMDIFYMEENRPLSKLIQLKISNIILSHRKAQLEEESGFESHDEQPEIARFNKIVRKRYDLQFQQQIEGNYQNKLLQEKVIQLERKVEDLQLIIDEMTSAFFKDMQHYKQMLYLTSNKEEIFEVDYSDTIKTLDDKPKQILEHYLSSVRLNYQSEIARLRKEFTRLESESEKLRRQTNVLLSKTDAQQLLKLVFQIEKNPYVLWKYIQDAVGNSFFFNIFEHRQHSYGIMYHEIDELIGQSQASNRIFQQVKEKMDDQLAILGKRASHEITILKQKLSDLGEGRTVTEKNQIDQLPSLDAVKTIVRKETAVKEEQMRKKQMIEMKHWMQSWDTVDAKHLIYEAVVRSALQRWSLITKFARLSDTIIKTLFELEVNYKQRQASEDALKQYQETSTKIKQLLFQLRKDLIRKSTVKRKPPINEIEEENHQLKDQIDRAKHENEEVYKKLEEVEGDCRILRLINNQIKIKNEQLSLQLEQNESYTANLKVEKQKLELSQLNIEKAFNFLMGKLGFRNHEVSLTQMDDKYSKQIEKFKTRIRQVRIEDINAIDEFSEFYAKTDYVYMNLGNLEKQGVNKIDQASLTNYFNITYSMAQFEPKDDDLQLSLTKDLYRRPTVDQEVQTGPERISKSRQGAVRRQTVINLGQSLLTQAPVSVSIRQKSQVSEYGSGTRRHSLMETSLLSKEIKVREKEKEKEKTNFYQDNNKSWIQADRYGDRQIGSEQIKEKEKQKGEKSNIQDRLNQTEGEKIKNRDNSSDLFKIKMVKEDSAENIDLDKEQLVKSISNSRNSSRGVFKQPSQLRNNLHIPFIKTENDFSQNSQVQSQFIENSCPNSYRFDVSEKVLTEPPKQKVVLIDLKLYGKLQPPQPLRSPQMKSLVSEDILMEQSESKRMLKIIQGEKRKSKSNSQYQSTRQKTQNGPTNIRLRPIYSIQSSNDESTCLSLQQIESLRLHVPPENILRQYQILIKKSESQTRDETIAVIGRKTHHGFTPRNRMISP